MYKVLLGNEKGYRGVDVRDILIFGTGKAGKTAVHLLEKEHHILFAVDNDRAKWGSSFEGYAIKSPAELLQYDCDIVITSTDYTMEILLQLQQMQIAQERIYFYWIKLIDGLSECTLYPADTKKVIGTGKRLVEYDLLHTEENESENIKVMVFCTFYSMYTKQLIENLSKRYGDIEFGLLTKAPEYKDRLHSEQLKHIYCFKTISDLKTIIERLPIYNAMQLLWIEREWAYLYEFIRNKTRRLNLNVGGSDFYRAGKTERDFKKNLIACADMITAETEGTIREFKEYYRKEAGDKVGFLPFGIEVLDFINLTRGQSLKELKQRYHIPLNKIIVTCGHNAIAEHQHADMIEALSKLPVYVKEKIVCVFPMTYPDGREEYIGSIRDKLNETGLDYVILTEFMDFQSMAQYALISDVMIHVQTTDQLSSTMLEEMYAGSIVIAGSWLPYRSLHEMGIYFLDVDAISEVTSILRDVVTDIERYKEKCKGNEKLIWKHSSWEGLVPKWRALWD